MLRHALERIFLQRRTDSIYDPARGTLAHQEHLRLLEAMERRDTCEAIAVVRRHIQAGKNNVMADLRQRQAIRELRPMDFMNLNDINH
jgi:DNA-binding GntR family transcriptional regulator